MFDYLCAFTKWADIEKFFRGQTTIDVIEKDKDGGGWVLRCASTMLEKKGVEIKAKKLVIAMVKEGKIKIIIDDIASLYGEQQVILKSGQVLETDAVVCATGWQKGYTFRFEPRELEKELGLPTTLPPTPEEEALIQRSEETLYTKFPYLKERDTSRVYHPNHSLRHAQQPTTDTQPYRLHRFMVPPKAIADRNIAFAGAVHCLGTFPNAYIQSLWITAYLDGTLSIPSSPTQTLEETYRNTQYCVLRGAMSYGHTLPDLVFDTLPYFDTLLKDMGLQERRKGGGVRECVSSYGPEDYRGLLEDVEIRMRIVRGFLK
ncbi:unnamed protein product [Alternaria alternata]